MREIAFPNLKIRIQEDNDTVTYFFQGDVDENFNQNDVPRISKKKLIFELKEIRNINSCGIREWIFFINDFKDLGHLIFRRCSVSVIDQANMMPDSLRGGTIESFYAPYFCKCGTEENCLIEVEKNIKNLKNSVAPEFVCKECKEPLEFDALEESYFQFATTLKG